MTHPWKSHPPSTPTGSEAGISPTSPALPAWSPLMAAHGAPDPGPASGTLCGNPADQDPDGVTVSRKTGPDVRPGDGTACGTDGLREVNTSSLDTQAVH